MEAEEASLDNAPLAFCLVVGAGLSTAVGAAAVFNNKMVKRATKPVLAAGLGFSGGVMIYVSFVEIFQKSFGAFVDNEYEEDVAYYLATLFFFLGLASMRLIKTIVDMLDGGHSHGVCDQKAVGQVQVNIGDAEGGAAQDAAGDEVPPAPPQADDAQAKEGTDAPLLRMGIKTAAAIAIHNFPEGLATFVATLVDESVGITLAVAIAIHNIPEGLCVALPVYYATNSRIKAFMWGLLSGISEPIGAAIGWIIIKSSGEDMNQFVYGLLFGLVAGMMVMIVVMELIPTAFQFDPQDKIVTSSVVLGMLVMAISLCLFMA